MKVAVATEIKADEYRVALTPIGVRELVDRGHEVLVQQGAGEGSSITDADYEAQGAKIVPTRRGRLGRGRHAAQGQGAAAAEVELLRAETILFTYLHLAPAPELTKGLRDTGATCIAYETVEDAKGRLPLLAPMSEIAGKIATQAGAFMLEKPLGGRGILLGGVPGVAAGQRDGDRRRRRRHERRLHRDRDGGRRLRLRPLDRPPARARRRLRRPRLDRVYSSTLSIEEMLPEIDLVIGGVLVHGAKAPHVITREQLALMKPSAVLVDVAIDQGGCFETSKPTTHSDPTYEVDGIIHYCVANMPGAVPITSTYALTNATLPYVLALADKGVVGGDRARSRVAPRRQRRRRQGHLRGGRRGRRRRVRFARGGAGDPTRRCRVQEKTETPKQESAANQDKDGSRMSSYAVVNPATGENVKDYPEISDSDLTAAIAKASEAHGSWSQTTSVAERAAMVKKVGDLHLERREALAEIAVREMGKPMEQALAEVDFCGDIYGYYADNAEDFLKDEPIDLLAGEGTALIRRTSVGPLLGIMPWNFPYYQVARFAGPNLIVGNTILLKPAPQCPESAEAIQNIYREAGFPDGAYETILATNDQIADVIADPRVRGVSLTGSERAGAAVAEIAGRNLKKVVLELGGSDPFILLSSDDLDGAVEAAVGARLDNTGQSCNAAHRRWRRTGARRRGH